jgi:hypothetical protein
MRVNIRKAVTGAALVGSTLVGGAIGASLIGTANAQTTTTQTPAASSNNGSTAPPGRPAFDPSQGGHVGPNGTKEELLTGSDAEKAKAAALAAVPGGTIQRVETDAEGAAYEAHMLKSDGTPVTVKMDKDFKVTGTETGGPGGPGHGHGADGPGGPGGPAAPAPTASNSAA